MRRVYAFHYLFWGLNLCLCAQTLTVEKPVVTPSQDKYKVVEAANLIHTIEGSSAVYKISVTGFDSIASVRSLRYNNSTNITSNCHLDKGVLNIDDVTINNLKANSTQAFKLTLVVREKGKDSDTECSAEAMSIKVYPTPSGKEVEKPGYLKFYKDTEGDLTWKFKGTGGSSWNCTWNIDNKDKTGASYTLPRIKEAKTSTLNLTAINVAPDGKTEWDRFEDNWQIVVLPEAIVEPSVPDNASEEFFQDQEWTLSVAVNGGNSSGWEYSWSVDDEKTDINRNSYTLSISESDRTTEEINRKVVLTVKNNLPSDTKPSKEELEWTYNYNAKFYPCPEVRFAESYPHNICDGDKILFGFVILDGQGQSLLNDPDYQWDYSWKGERNETYAFVGNNKNNNDGDTYSIECEISGKLKGIEKPYIKTLKHNVSVWPKPFVYPLTETESSYVSCGGRTVPVSINTFGGQKDGWEFYYGKKDGVATLSKENNHGFQIVRESQNSIQPVIEWYTMRAVNLIEGNIRCDTTLSIRVEVYPAPWMPNEVIIMDKNRQNASVENGIREGNELALFCDECYGGYPNAWKYSWSKDNTIISDTNQALISIENEYSSDTKNDSRILTIRCGVNNYYGSEPWVVQEYNKQLIIYNKPQTPTSLVRKGNGTSETMIATTNVSDTDLDGHEYYLVFGYLDNSGQMHDAASLRQQNPGEVRWSTQIPSSEINNSSNNMYVYALWKYNNGVEITSGIRYVDGLDEYWDGSSYSGKTRSVIANATSIDFFDYDETKKPQEFYSVNGVKLHKPSKGFNIVKMSDGSVKKVIIK